MQKKTKIITISVIIALFALLMVLLTQKKSSNISQVEDMSAKATVYTKIGEQEIDITNLIEQNPAPTLSAGMIPIKQDGEYWKITTFDDNSWYDYASEKPAYIMLNDGVYQSEEYYQMPNSKKLAENNIGTQIANEDLGSIYVWIPKFAYSKDGKIIYIKAENIIAGSYTMPDIFTYTKGNQEFSLSGIWLEYNSTSVSDITDFNNNLNKKMNSLNKGENDNTYGFLANTKACTFVVEKITDDGIVIDNTKTQERINAINIFDTYLKTNSEKNKQLINDIDNSYRTIISTIDPENEEPIRGKAKYNTQTEKIDIEVTFSLNGIVKILNSKGIVLSENSLTADSKDELIGNQTYTYIAVDTLGNMKEIKTTVSGLNVYVIPDLETLKRFRDEVNAGNNFSGIKVIQTEDIDMNPGKHWTNENTGVEEFAEDAEQWTRIGRFYGEYNGGNHTISGMYINNDSYSQALFYSIESSAKIKNLKLKQSTIKCQSGAGIIAEINGHYGSCSVDNCHNEAYVFAYGSGCGGIVGNISRGTNTISNCSNKGNIICDIGKSGIYGVNGYAGIVGISGPYGGKTYISKCYNAGKIYSKSEAGGIAGTTSDTQIRECYNTGEISCASDTAGGICGNTYDNYLSDSFLINCYNTGNIIGGSTIGGLVGDNRRVGNSAAVAMKNCYNIGNVTGTSTCGAIYGTIKGSTSRTYTLANCVNGAGSGKTESEMKELTSILNIILISYYSWDEDTKEQDAWIDDTTGINNGYPILAWQVE